MKTLNARCIRRYALLATLMVATTSANAQATATSDSASGWPNKTLRVVVPFTPGSGTDAVGRIVSERLSAQLGQTIVIENRPGAGGTIGMAVVAKANPDGYTILVHSSSYTVTPTTYPNTPYNTLRDFSGITPLSNLPNVLVISPSKGVRSVKDLIASAKAKPGSLTYASAGAGSATQLNAERFRMGAGLEGTHVPFKGTPEALTDVITGRIDIYFCPVISVLQFLKEGRLLGLAVGSTKRSSALPDLPTTLEAGVPNSDYNFWVGMAVPSKTPGGVITKLHQSTLKTLQTADITERMAKLGAEQMQMTPREFDAYIKTEIGANATLVKAAKINVN
ncbi:MAG: tripartite tricarboxylate transporter substrate binding protein [Burkholderiales bacterium]